MLARFSMANVLSFKSKATLTLTTVPAYKQHPYNLIKGTRDDYVRFAAIYGANASGKSNFYYGMMMFRDIVLNSMNNIGEIEDNILERCYNPFAFDTKDEPSEYEITICTQKKEYRYGFVFNANAIISESLYVIDYETGRQTMIIERDMNSISIGSSIRRECDKYKTQIPASALALTFFSRLSLKTDVFEEVYSEISRMMIADSDFFENKRVMGRFLPNVIDKRKEELIEFLTAIDTGIKDITYESVDRKIEFFTYHQGKGKRKYHLNLYNESQGTIKSIIFFIMASSVIYNGGIMIIDELNTKLHPLLMKFIIDLFKNKKSKAQLIYTTHDTTLLDKQFFRRDQVWFVEKDLYGYSEITALADFKIRSDASFEKDYLSGVYGGIPTLLDYTMDVKD